MGVLRRVFCSSGVRVSHEARRPPAVEVLSVQRSSAGRRSGDSKVTMGWEFGLSVVRAWRKSAFSSKRGGAWARPLRTGMRK